MVKRQHRRIDPLPAELFGSEASAKGRMVRRIKGQHRVGRLDCVRVDHGVFQVLVTNQAMLIAGGRQQFVAAVLDVTGGTTGRAPELRLVGMLRIFQSQLAILV
jgi:hypothetical protein